MQPGPIVTTISLPLATNAMMKPINRKLMRCAMSMPVDAKNRYALK